MLILVRRQRAEGASGSGRKAAVRGHSNSISGDNAQSRHLKQVTDVETLLELLQFVVNDVEHSALFVSNGPRNVEKE